MPFFLGIDTSNYTTSAALYDSGSDTMKSTGRLLEVPPGTAGLRQSEALFQHVKRLPEILGKLDFRLESVRAVGVSARPSGREGSYMPCFLAGLSLSRCLGAASGIPVFEFTHQQGHIAAAAWSCGCPELIGKEHLAWHLSGGTTELLRVKPDEERLFSAVRIGGTRDLTAGQLIDRAGNMLGLAFPSGRELDRLSRMESGEAHYPVKVKNAEFSLSGLQNQAENLHSLGKSDSRIARFLIKSICAAVSGATEQALLLYPGLPVLCSGGVSSNTMLRESLSARCGARFAAPEYSADCAAGPAYLSFLSWKTGRSF